MARECSLPMRRPRRSIGRGARPDCYFDPLQRGLAPRRRAGRRRVGRRRLDFWVRAAGPVSASGRRARRGDDATASRHRPASPACRRLGRHREGHALPVLARVDRDHVVDRHDDLARRAAETRLELDEVVAELQRAGRLEADVEHDLAVLHVLASAPARCVDEHRDIRREAVVGAPVVQRADQVRAGRRALRVAGAIGGVVMRRASRRYLRMTFSDGVSASM